MIKKKLYYIQLELGQSRKLCELQKVDKGLFILKNQENFDDLINTYDHNFLKSKLSEDKSTPSNRNSIKYANI